MSVYVCVPSARPVEHVVQWAAAWRAMGYRVALWRDEWPVSFDHGFDLWRSGEGIGATRQYPGYAVAVNELVKDVLARDPACNWIVTGGDDVYPDPNYKAEEIARQCEGWFGHPGMPQFLPTFGVMQPTGDQYGVKPNNPDPAMRGAYITRVCGSPFMGREFCRRINQGRGPLWPEYRHMFVDEELQNVALKNGVLWQRSDLTHHHEHWARARSDRADMPAFLAEVSGPKHWAEAKALFESRKAAGFPGSEPL